MPLISYKCPVCSSEIKTDDSLCGDEVKCPSCASLSKIPIPGVYPGLNLGGFIMEKQLGVGGMGEVWLAKQANLNRHVALKVLSPKYTHNSSFVERFMNEVKNTAKFEHPNIVTAFHAGVENQIYYMAISYVNGTTVFDKLYANNTPFSEKEALQIIRPIADALDYAWSEFKILHRDIKPSNIMIDKKGIPKLMDMGISKSLEEESSLTLTGIMIGTPYYISPEQAIGAKDIDFRADVYSLGATLYHMITGNVPYDATTAMAIVSKHLSEPLPDPRHYNTTLSEQIVSLIKIMMAKDKNDRQKSWRAVIDDIDRVVKGEFPITPIPDANKTAIETRSAANLPPSHEATITDRTIATEDNVVEESIETQATEKKVKSKNNTPILVIVLSLFFLIFLCLGLIGGFFAYKHWKARSEKRKSPLPTEIIPKIPKKQDKLPEPYSKEPEQIPKYDFKSDKPMLAPKDQKSTQDTDKISTSKTIHDQKLPENPLPPEGKPKQEEEKKDSRKRPNW